MADPKEEKKIEVSESLIVEMQKTLEESKRKIAELEAANLVAAVESGKKDIRELESLEERFKNKEYTVRKISMRDEKGNVKEDIVIGWTSKGAYPIWDKSGPNAVQVLMYDVFLLNGSKDKPTTISAETLFSGERVKCTEVSKDINIQKHKTGEEIEVTQWDDKHGITATGIIIDGYYAIPEGTITVKIPGVDEPVTMNINHLNA